MSGGGKGEIEAKLEAFVKRSFDKFQLKIDEGESISRSQAKELIQELMKKYGHENAWDEDEFDRMFDLFQEDGEEDEGANPQAQGLDKNEFTKLVSRMAQL